MPFRKFFYLIPVLFGSLLMAGLMVFWPASPANAQCGSQASSCKNCHEVQGQDPVNNDGTNWHQSHSFGDFCYICHAGNNQSMDKEIAHTGMVPPLSDVKSACQSCHPGDLMERAQVYATALGVEIGTGSGGAPTSSGPSSLSSGGGDSTASAPAASAPAASAPAASAPAAPASSEIVVDQKDIIDYNMIYSGKRPINWGNLAVSFMIVAILAGGGSYVYWNERKLRGVPSQKALQASQTAATPAIPTIEGYSSDVLALLPQIAQLNPIGLHALKRLLENPDEASELLHSLSRLDPDLVRRIRALDRESRALLLALSGD